MAMQSKHKHRTLIHPNTHRSSRRKHTSSSVRFCPLCACSSSLAPAHTHRQRAHQRRSAPGTRPLTRGSVVVVVVVVVCQPVVVRRRRHRSHHDGGLPDGQVLHLRSARVQPVVESQHLRVHRQSRYKSMHWHVRVCALTEQLSRAHAHRHATYSRFERVIVDIGNRTVHN